MTLNVLLSLAGRSIFKVTDIDVVEEILEKREEDPFDWQWVEISEGVESSYADLNDKDINIIENIRNNIFLSSDKFFGISDISSYVSDDFELISKAIVCGSTDKRVTWLLRHYVEVGIPHSCFYEDDLTLSEYINDLVRFEN